MDPPPIARRLRSALTFSIGTATVVLVWSVSIFLVGQSNLERLKNTTDLSALLFGAAALALFMFTLLLAGLVVFGWRSLVSTVSATVHETIAETNEPFRRDMKGRQRAFEGYLLGYLSTDPVSLELKDKALIAEAVDRCQDAYNILKGADEAAEFMALNNLIYYSALAGDRSRSDFLLTSARKLMEVGQEHNALNLMLTACRVILKYSTNRDEGRYAYEILTAIASSKKATERERSEAHQCLASIPEP